MGHRIELIVTGINEAKRRDRVTESRQPNGIGTADERPQGTDRSDCKV